MNGTSRLRWLCRRGMKELDVLLVGFLERGYPALDEAGQRGFARLLERQDPEIYALLSGRVDTDDPEIERVVQRIRSDAGL